jgi:hypothetical protein
MDTLLACIVNNKEFAYTILGGGGFIGVATAFVRFLRRRRSAPRRILKNLEGSMADLFNDMQTDLKDHPLIREFFVSSFKGQAVNSTKPRFDYNPTDVPGLVVKVGILANRGFVRDVTSISIPIYLMSEEFVSYLTKRGPC